MPPVLIIAAYQEKAGWALPEELVDRIRKVAGDRFEVFQARSLSDVNSRLGDAEVIFGARIRPENIALAGRLRWVHSGWAGVEGALFPEFAAGPIILTNSSGIHGVPISEHAIMLMLALSRRLPECIDAQREGRWGEAHTNSEAFGELLEKAVAIVGLGSIGEALAARLKAMAMTVIGVKRRPSGYIGAADAVLGMGELQRAVAKADYVVNLLPITPATRGIFTEAVIAAMKPTAYFINCGRGATVDEGALARALDAGKIAGAGLDVFAEEPLPQNSPLWRMRNVIITPHVAGCSPRVWERATALFCENLRRYIAGEALLNVVDKEQGY